MILFPAIDLKNGEVVRLQQGDMTRATVFNRDPAEQARAFEKLGFEYLHIVDLDGAFAGKPVNAAAVERILAAVDIPVQLGGGIRDRAVIDAWLAKGVARVVIGTAAVRNPELVREAAQAHPGHVAVGLDARDGKVAVEGWAQSSELSVLELAKRFVDAGVSAIVYTDIARDGMLRGLNIDATVALARQISIPVIASGGLASLDDVRALLTPLGGPIAGAIAGRALYDGRLDPAAALALIGQAATDSLTGLLSRRSFVSKVQLIDARMTAADRYSVVLFDIDGFAKTTYAYGPRTADRVLQRLGAVLAAEQTLVARYGGDEFVVVLSDADAANARAVAEKYLHEFASVRIDETTVIKVICSFGVSTLRPGEAMEGMIARAARALDAAKRQGGGRVVVADTAMVD